jgi:hypothetical protein
MCKCLVIVDKKLSAMHTRVSLTHILIKGSFLSFPTILTEKTQGAPRGSRPKTMVPSFCPFCGKKYPSGTPPSPAPAPTEGKR